jgi:hypothetical protein
VTGVAGDWDDTDHQCRFGTYLDTNLRDVVGRGAEHQAHIHVAPDHDVQATVLGGHVRLVDQHHGCGIVDGIQ